MDYFIVIKNFLNPVGLQSPISVLKVTTILPKGWTLPIGEASAGRVCPAACAAGLFYIYISNVILLLEISYLIRNGFVKVQPC